MTLLPIGESRSPSFCYKCACTLCWIELTDVELKLSFSLLTGWGGVCSHYDPGGPQQHGRGDLPGLHRLHDPRDRRDWHRRTGHGLLQDSGLRQGEQTNPAPCWLHSKEHLTSPWDPTTFTTDTVVVLHSRHVWDFSRDPTWSSKTYHNTQFLSFVVWVIISLVCYYILCIQVNVKIWEQCDVSTTI